MMNEHPTEGKVWAGATGGTAGASVAAFLSWLLGVAVWGAPADSDGATEAIAAVPWPVVGMLGLLLTFGGAFASGWLAKHTPRPLEPIEDEVEDVVDEDGEVDLPEDELLPPNPYVDEPQRERVE